MVLRASGPDAHEYDSESELGMNAVEFHNISYSVHDRPILQEIEFAVREGSGFAILGPNGAGKTTSIRVMGGLVRPDGGEVRVYGHAVQPRDAHNLRARMGFQLDGSLYERLTAYENLSLWGELYGHHGAALKRRVDELLELFRLTGRSNSKLAEFSKGMKQQIALSRAIIAEPDLLVLDEPTSGLSPEVAEDVISYITDYKDSRGATIILCTHELYGLDRLVDSVCILDKGRVLDAGGVEGLKWQFWPKRRFIIATDTRTANAPAIWENNFWGPRQLDWSACGDHFVVEFDAEPEDLELALTTIWGHGGSVLSASPIERSLRDLYFASLNKGSR